MGDGGTEGVHLYHGQVEGSGEDAVVVPSAQLHLFTYQGKETLVSLAQDTRLLGYWYEDYSGGSYRFKDDPVEENYDWTALGIRVLGGLVIVGTVVVGAGVFTAVIAGIKTSMVMGAAAVYGSMAVGATAVNDMVQGQISGMSEYVRVAFNGSIIGAMTGATACIPAKGLGIMGKYAAEFCIGAGESAFEQQLWEGKINFKEAAGHGILSVILTGVIDNLAGQGRKVIEGGSKLKIEEVIPPGSTHPVKVYTDGNAQINTGKIDTYIHGKVELDVEATTTRIDELKDLRKSNPENFTKEMKKELQECEDRLHNYQRSQEMSNTLNTARIEDTIENNQMIVENLFDAAKEVTEGNTEIISYIEGVNGKVQVVSRWKILPDGTPYLATVILKLVK